jgi:hypothetical protein
VPLCRYDTLAWISVVFKKAVYMIMVVSHRRPCLVTIDTSGWHSGWRGRRGPQGHCAAGCVPPVAGYRDRRWGDDQAHLAQHGHPHQEVADVHHVPGQPKHGQHPGV